MKFLLLLHLIYRGVSIFSDDEFIAADGSFEGDGRFKCSCKNLGNQQKKLYNNCFREVWMQVENTYQRVGSWFPLLGMIKKKLPYSEQVKHF